MMPTRKQTILVRLAVVVLILVTMVIYMPPFIRSFVGDDYIQFDYVKPFVRHPATILQVFNPTAVPWYYRPTQNIWFWINRLVLGWEPFGYYIILLWFHALVIALMFRVGRQLRLGPLAALCTAVLFAIHSHWVDVITWISSVAIVMGAVFSLLAVSRMLTYLARPSTRQLLLIFALTWLALVTHEETIFLPPFLLLLLLLWRWEHQWKERGERNVKKPRRKRTPHVPPATRQLFITKQEGLFFGLMALAALALLIIQFTRPNPTVQVSDRALAEWLTFLRWPEVAEFILVTTFRLSFVYPLLNLSGLAANLFIVMLVFLLGAWFWQGNWAARFGLLWALAHLFFIYWALWTQLPNLYAGRHIYQAGIGLALAVGAIIQQVLAIETWQLAIGTRSLTLRPSVVTLLILLVLGLFTLHHIGETRKTQQVWLGNVTEEETAKAQLVALFPQITEKNHVFSFRFPILPDFTRSVMQVWYDVWLERPGGSLKHLAAQGTATPDTIVLDYENGQVYDLMPQLADGAETLFLWTADADDMTVVTAVEGKQLALPITPLVGRGVGNRYRVDILDAMALHTAVYTQPGITYRIFLTGEDGVEQAAFELPAPFNDDEAGHWQEIKIPLDVYAGQKISIRLETLAAQSQPQTAYFANPRVVR